jgi:serine phosphatase RsbU (regulator of sigma subunit)
MRKLKTLCHKSLRNEKACIEFRRAVFESLSPFISASLAMGHAATLCDCVRDQVATQGDCAVSISIVGSKLVIQFAVSTKIKLPQLSNYSWDVNAEGNKVMAYQCDIGKSSVEVSDLISQIFNRKSRDELFEEMQGTLEQLAVSMSDAEKTHAKIEEMHNQTRASIEYASIIQKSILPVKDRFPQVFPDSFVHWQPKDIVGGDIWFFDRIRREGEFLLFVIDCTGHGVPGAFVTMLVKSIQRSIMMECRIARKEIHPGELLSIFNREIKNLLDQNVRESESNAGFDGGILYFDLKRRYIMRYAGAETPLFLVDKEGKCKTIKGSRHSVGYRSCDEEFVYEEHEISLDSFDKLYLTTDGLLDQNGGEKEFPFGKKRLISILETNNDKPINEIKKLVMNYLDAWKGNSEQNDDITFVGIKI